MIYFEDLAVGQSAEITKRIGNDEVVAFAELSGDCNPVHLSEHYAATTRFKHRIAHGMLTASLISAVLGTKLPGPGAIYVEQTLHFRAPVYLDDVVTAHVEVAALRTFRLVILKCECLVEGALVLEGWAMLKVPGRPEKSS